MIGGGGENDSGVSLGVDCDFLKDFLGGRFGSREKQFPKLLDLFRVGMLR